MSCVVRKFDDNLSNVLASPHEFEGSLHINSIKNILWSNWLDPSLSNILKYELQRSRT
jgi:hypothetical protein